MLTGGLVISTVGKAGPQKLTFGARAGKKVQLSSDHVDHGKGDEQAVREERSHRAAPLRGHRIVQLQ